MLYDVRLWLTYAYDGWVRDDRHHVRVVPLNIPGVQRVIAAALGFDPLPDHRTDFIDFFGNAVTSFAYSTHHDHLDVRLNARVEVESPPPLSETPYGRDALADDLAALRLLTPDSPHHFLGVSPRVPLDPAITDYARASIEPAISIEAAAMNLCLAIHRDFAYDSVATEVETSPTEAFGLRRGVCQDFAHVMIAGLRGLGVPAGYVSGYLRTTPPPGQQRLEGADAMHAWVRVWCGPQVGWRAFDPTNATRAGTDHIVIAHGRDYSDISPIVGVLRTSGEHRTRQSVDVTAVDKAP